MTLKSEVQALLAKGDVGSAMAHLIDNLPSPSTPGVQVTHKFPFTHATPNLITGATAVFTDGYTPAIGDILHDAWFEIATGWDGTTPLGDVSTFPVGQHWGWFNELINPLRMDVADTGGAFLRGTINQGGSGANVAPFDVASSLSIASAIYWVGNLAQSPDSTRQLPTKFGTTDPLKVCVSQDGGITGADPGSTQGAAVLYVVTSTPHP